MILAGHKNYFEVQNKRSDAAGEIYQHQLEADNPSASINGPFAVFKVIVAGGTLCMGLRLKYE